jgi:hypothetical protein
MSYKPATLTDTESFNLYKKEALKAAEELYYSSHIRAKISMATTSNQIANIMQEARESDPQTAPRRYWKHF